MTRFRWFLPAFLCNLGLNMVACDALAPQKPTSKDLRESVASGARDGLGTPGNSAGVGDNGSSTQVAGGGEVHKADPTPDANPGSEIPVSSGATQEPGAPPSPTSEPTAKMTVSPTPNPTPTVTSNPIPTPTPTPSPDPQVEILKKTWAGQWLGKVSNPSNSFVQMDIQESGGSSKYPPQDCAGKLTIDSATETELEMHESNGTGTDCLNAGKIVMKITGAGTASWEWTLESAEKAINIEVLTKYYGADEANKRLQYYKTQEGHVISAGTLTKQ